MDLLTHIPLPAYLCGAILLATAIFKISADIHEIRVTNRMRRLAITATGEYHRPRLSIILQVRSLDASLATAQAWRKAHDNTEFIFIVHSNELARKLRAQAKKHHLTSIRVITHAQPDLLAVACRYASGQLIAALPDSRPTASFYWQAIMPFADRRYDAVAITRSVHVDTTLSSGVEALYWSLRHYLQQFRHQSLPGDTLPVGIILRTSALGETISRQRIALTIQPSYSVGTYRTPLATARSLSATFLHPWILLLIASTIIVAFTASVFSKSIPLVLVLIGISFVTSWWALGRTASYRFFSRLTILLTLPLLITSLPLLALRRMVSK